MSDSLYNEFNSISAKQWKQKIQADLNGVDYNEALVWETNDGIKVKPFYHQEEFKKLPIKSTKKNCSICQSIFISDEKTASYLAKDALQKGATSLQFEANTAFDIKELLIGIVAQSDSEESLKIHFKLNFLSESFLSDLIAQTKTYKVYLNIDLIGNLAKTGNWFYNQNRDHEVLGNMLKVASNNTSILSVDVALYQNAGATIVQQVAYALAHGNEYLNHLDITNSSLSTKVLECQTSCNEIQFHFAVGSNYFFEIAKLRAFKYLWKLLLEAYEQKSKAIIFVQPSVRNKTIYDYNVNLLRTTTECMSAILGGADSISNLAYDAVYHKKNEFGERISRNQLLILQEESYFRVANQIADGSYYIETITEQVSEKALTLFKDIEKNGGFLKQLQAGTIQRKIEESALNEQVQFDNGEVILLGTNKHTNPNDKMKDELALYPFVKINPRKTLIKPIIARRLAEKLEKERLDTT